MMEMASLDGAVPAAAAAVAALKGIAAGQARVIDHSGVCKPWWRRGSQRTPLDSLRADSGGRREVTSRGHVH